MILIDSKNSVNTHKKLLDRFKEIYLEAFPDEMEREDFYDILVRVKFGDFPKTVIILQVESDKLLGGMIVDIYHNQIFHLTYLVTDKKFRGHGCAKTLVKEGLPKLINNYSSVATGVFVETNIPEMTKNDSFSPESRIKIFDKLGMKLIPIKYIQPPLDVNKSHVLNLQLLYYPIVELSEISTGEVIYFLNSLYQSLEQPEDNPSLEFMRNSLNDFGDTVELKSIN